MSYSKQEQKTLDALVATGAKVYPYVAGRKATATPSPPVPRKKR